MMQPGVMSAGWGVALLLFAPLVLMPIAFDLAATVTRSRGARTDRFLVWSQVAASWALVVAYLSPVGTTATLLAMPWSSVLFAATIDGAVRILRRRTADLSEFTVDAGRLFLAVAAVAVLLDRAGVSPLDFDSVIILLTGVHFHYAGFLLPVVAAMAVRALPTNRLARLGAVGIAIGTPLTGLGIMLTHLKGPPIVEVAAVWLLVVAVMCVAVVHYQLAAATDAPRWSKRLWSLAATSLVVGMAMAAAYGSRSSLPLPQFDIPMMRAVHGSINAFGFAACSLLGWYVFDRTAS